MHANGVTRPCQNNYVNFAECDQYGRLNINDDNAWVVLNRVLVPFTYIEYGTQTFQV